MDPSDIRIVILDIKTGPWEIDPKTKEKVRYSTYTMTIRKPPAPGMNHSYAKEKHVSGTKITLEKMVGSF